jgi:hypothetical protein
MLLEMKYDKITIWLRPELIWPWPTLTWTTNSASTYLLLLLLNYSCYYNNNNNNCYQLPNCCWATSTIQFSYKIQVLLLLAPAILIFNCYSYHPPRRWSCFTSLCICEVTAKWIVDCCDLLVLLCIPSISITSLPPIQHRLYCNELLPPSKKNGHGIRSRILSTMNVRYGQHIHWFIVIILHEQSYKYCLCTKIGAMQ